MSLYKSKAMSFFELNHFVKSEFQVFSVNYLELYFYLEIVSWGLCFYRFVGLQVHAAIKNHTSNMVTHKIFFQVLRDKAFKINFSVQHR